jgi:hypothetical protein
LFIGGTGNIGIGTAGPSEALDVNSGNVKLGNGNVILSTSGKGIDFSATAGTGTSELLNDYEEGTFTPNIGGTATYTAQAGTYTKIGNRVYISMRLTVLIAGTGEDYRISGLPFSAAAISSASIGYFASLKSNQTYLSANFVGSTINMTGTTVATANITSGPGVIGNSTDIVLSGFYYV